MKKNKHYISELDTVRAIACLCVVLLHSINFGAGGGNYHVASGIDKILIAVSGIMSFGTTTFIFISGLILAYSYPKKLPKNFYIQRVKYIFIPFVFTSLIFAVYNSQGSLFGSIKLFIFNLMGLQHWFVLVVLQFYVLYPFFNRIFQKYSYKKVLPVALFVNISYLGIFNLFSSPLDNVYINYIWLQGYWVPFLGWIFYFAVAYYAGRNYVAFVQFIRSNIKWIYILLPISIAITLRMNEIGSFGFGSKRIDMILLSTLLIFILLTFANKVKVHPILKVVSRYSFGIYLLHYLFLSIMDRLFHQYDLYSTLGYLSILMMFIISTTCSISMIYLVNRFKIGKFLFGQVKSSPKQIQKKMVNNMVNNISKRKTSQEDTVR